MRPSANSYSGRAAAIALAIVFMVCATGQATTFRTVLPTSTPQSALVTGPDGNLYGTSSYGGVNDLGAIFRLTSAGVYTVIYSFTGGPDGSHPVSALVAGPDGLL